MDISSLTVKKFQEGLRRKEFSAFEVAQNIFKRIEEYDGELGAYLCLLKDDALRRASEVDAALAGGENLPPLAGVPLAIKDNIVIKEVPATAASQVLKEYIGAYDAHVIRRLREQCAVFLGKTNLDEFAMGASTEHSAYKLTRNPLNTDYVPGGSSGGSAAAVAAGEALAALGSDTGGSVRHPAAFCGIVGFRPTYGAVSRSGLIAMASSLDVIGPMGKTVEDVVLLFDAIRGRDEFDATSRDIDFSMRSFDGLRGMKIGIPKEYFGKGVDDEIEKGISLVRKQFEELGFETREVSLPHTEYAVACYYIIMPAEASTNLARYDGIQYGHRERAGSLGELYVRTRGEGFGEEVKRRIMLGTFSLSSGYYDAYYAKAQNVRGLIADDFDKVFGDVDILLTPTAPTAPFKIGEKSDDPLALYMEDAFAAPASLAGIPAMSMPVAGYETSDGFPVGFQLIGKRGRDGDLLSVGKLYEESVKSG